ncbi:MAG TPA: rhodanese-like domain-containing protein [Candidatus Rifleibacterium sp.]|nr:rhodanese-like domain-containing protein [Candidatus Rifleibacterium sp.]HPT45208.1 rhodanese-like domain-containing protein [Candidatus Rifleibacterium sp.]
MKSKFLFLAIALITSFGVTLYSEEGCSSCSAGHTEEKAVNAAPAAPAVDGCTDGTCAPTDKSEKAAAPAAVEGKEEAPATLNTAGLKALIGSGQPITILDARSGKFDDGKRLPGALSLNSESKPEEIAKLLPNKDALVVTYCANLKCPASHNLYTHLKSLGYSNLIEYPEGIQGWVEAGNPVNAAK